MQLFVLAFSMFSPSVPICEVNTDEFLNVRDSNLSLWKWRSRTLTIWIKWQVILLCQRPCMCTKIGGASSSSRLFLRQFRDIHTVVNLRGRPWPAPPEWSIMTFSGGEPHYFRPVNRWYNSKFILRASADAGGLPSFHNCSLSLYFVLFLVKYSTDLFLWWTKTSDSLYF